LDWRGAKAMLFGACVYFGRAQGPIYSYTEVARVGCYLYVYRAALASPTE